MANSSYYGNNDVHMLAQVALLAHSLVNRHLCCIIYNIICTMVGVKVKDTAGGVYHINHCLLYGHGIWQLHVYSTELIGLPMPV